MAKRCMVRERGAGCAGPAVGGETQPRSGREPARRPPTLARLERLLPSGRSAASANPHRELPGRLSPAPAPAPAPAADSAPAAGSRSRPHRQPLRNPPEVRL